MARYIIYSEHGWDGFFVTDIHAYLQSKGHEVVVREKARFLSATPGAGLLLRIERAIAVQSSETSRYFLISHCDREIVTAGKPLLLEAECIGMLKCQFRRGCYEGFEEKVSPFTYRVKNSFVYDAKRASLTSRPRTTPKLAFKGNTLYGRAPILKSLADLVNAEYSSRGTGTLDQSSYLEHLASARLALSLPGNGNFCHRELEAFGLGVPVLQPELLNSYFEPLEPNVHYCATGSHPLDPRRQSDAIRARYMEASEDADLLSRIAVRALSWYDRNVAFPGNMQLMERILSASFQYELSPRQFAKASR